MAQANEAAAVQAEARWRAAEATAEATYHVSRLAALANYRAELAYLEAGGKCFYTSAEERMSDLRKLVDEWSRVLEGGESPSVVWPDAGAAPTAKQQAAPAPAADPF